MATTTLHNLTPAQRRQIIQGFAGKPLRVTMRDRSQHDLIIQALAQDECSEADQFSSKASLVVAKFYATPQLLVLRLTDLWSWEPLELNVTDPNHPDYTPETRVSRPIPVEAMASRKRGGTNRHEQA